MCFLDIADKLKIFPNHSCPCLLPYLTSYSYASISRTKRTLIEKLQGNQNRFNVDINLNYIATVNF